MHYPHPSALRFVLRLKQFIDLGTFLYGSLSALSVKAPRHQPLAQKFQAVHFGFDAAPAVGDDLVLDRARLPLAWELDLPHW